MSQEKRVAQFKDWTERLWDLMREMEEANGAVGDDLESLTRLAWKDATRVLGIAGEPSIAPLLDALEEDSPHA